MCGDISDVPGVDGLSDELFDGLVLVRSASGYIYSSPTEQLLGDVAGQAQLPATSQHLDSSGAIDTTYEILLSDIDLLS